MWRELQDGCLSSDAAPQMSVPLTGNG